MANIILNYADEDIKRAEMLANALENQGWTTFWDRTSLPAGEAYETTIEQEIKQADCMIVAWSEASKQSVWVRRKAGIGRERNILVPILFEQVDLPVVFSSLRTVKLIEWEGEADAPGFLELCKVINETMHSKTASSISSVSPKQAFRETISSAKSLFVDRFKWTKLNWLSTINHQQKLMLIASGLSLVVILGWQVNRNSTHKPSEKAPEVLASGIGSINADSLTTTKSVKIANKEAGNTNNVDAKSALVNKIVSSLTKKLVPGKKANDTEIKALTEVVTDLSRGQGSIGTDEQIKTALNALTQGDTDQTKELFTKATEKADQEAKKGAKAYRNLGAMMYLDNTQESLIAYRRATELDPDNADAWGRLGILLMRTGDLDEAILASNKELTLAKGHDNKLEIANTYSNLGIIYHNRGELSKALEYHKRALALNEELGQKEGVASAYSNLGSIYQTRGNLEKAAEYQQKALAVDEKDGMASAYGNLGNVFFIRGKLDKAVEYYQKALALDESLGHEEGMANAYSNLGIVYFKRGELSKALDYHKKALALNESLGRKQGVVDAYTRLGNIYQQKGQKEEAKLAYERVVDYYHEMGNPNMGNKVKVWLNAL